MLWRVPRLLRAADGPKIPLYLGRNLSVQGSPVNIARLLDSSEEHQDQHITIEGWIRSTRKQKKVSFAAIADGSCSQPLQAVLDPGKATNLSVGQAVVLSGTWQASQGKGQAFELVADTVQPLGPNDSMTDPIQNKYQTPEFLRTVPHMRPRSAHNATLLRLRSTVIALVTRFFAEKEFVQTHPPIITSSDCEGAGEVFRVIPNTSDPDEVRSDDSAKDSNEHFFQAPKYLTVSSQLHLEALSQSVKNVWTLSPTFRAEKSDTARHLSEFYMLEAESAFVDDLEQVMSLVESLLRYMSTELKSSQIGSELLSRHESMVVEEVEHNNPGVSATLPVGERWRALIDGPWPRITYQEAVKKLQAAHDKAGFEHYCDLESGLQAEHERWLAEVVGRQGPVFVTHYPAAQKPFYMLPTTASGTESAASNGATVECFDLLLPEICEVAGGSLREHRLNKLLESMTAKGVYTPNSELSDTIEGRSGIADRRHRSELDWYVDLRRYGSVPHGGFGLGLDRLLGYLAGVPNVRDVVTFPRWYGRCIC